MKDINTDATYETWLSKYGGYANSMTLRDYFGAKAMQGLLSDPDWRKYMNFEETAYAAYKQANAMLKARQSNG
jgi:hypothetical protein